MCWSTWVSHSCFRPLGQRFCVALPVVIILALVTESEPCWMGENTTYIQCSKWAGAHWYRHFKIVAYPHFFLYFSLVASTLKDPPPQPHFMFSTYKYLCYCKLYMVTLPGFRSPALRSKRAADQGWSACRPISQSFIQVLLNHSLNQSLKQFIQNNDSFRKEKSLDE